MDMFPMNSMAVKSPRYWGRGRRIPTYRNPAATKLPRMIQFLAG
jgi:hypothetical protein